MQLPFRAMAEREPGPKWLAHFRRVWPAYEAWFLSEGETERPGYLTCHKMLSQAMPELVRTWETLTELAGGADRVARMLSMYRPPRYLAGCSQVVWTRDEPVLIRNYDYHPELCEGLFMCSGWTGGQVIASTDSLWGALDGMNEHGVAVALAFGGSRDVGDGFGIPIILRYALEIATTTPEAVEVVSAVPSHMVYNISIIDRHGRSATVYVHPHRRAEVVATAAITNHQRRVTWPEHARLTRTMERQALLLECLEDNTETLDRLASRFIEPPLYSTDYLRGHGTLYTAIYRPARGTVEYRWPDRSWHQSFDRFNEGESVIHFTPGSGSGSRT